MLPSFTTRSYTETFEGCLTQFPDLCTILKTYLSTVKFCFIVWLTTLVIGFTVAYFLAFYVRTVTMQMVLFLHLHDSVLDLERDPHDLLDSAARAQRAGQPCADARPCRRQAGRVAALFAVLGRLAFTHLFTFFMVVPIFNSMMRIDRRLIEAAYDSGASAWQTLWNLIIPLCKPGIVIGSIFVVTIVMGDFITFDVMGGEQIASAGKVVETRLNALQFPPAAAECGDPACGHAPDHRRPQPHRRRAQRALTMGEGRSPAFYWLAAFFAAFVLFLYGPMIVIFILSFQGPTGGLTFPLNGLSLPLVRAACGMAAASSTSAARSSVRSSSAWW